MKSPSFASNNCEEFLENKNTSAMTLKGYSPWRLSYMRFDIWEKNMLERLETLDFVLLTTIFQFEGVKSVATES